MACTLIRYFNNYSIKFLLSKLFNTQCNRKMLNIDYRTLSYKTYFTKMPWSFMNFRYLCVSEQLKNEVKKVTITFVRHDGVKFKKVVAVGTEINTIFEWHGLEIPGFGACHGNQECATCHVKFPKHLRDMQEEPTSDEFDTLVCANQYDIHYSRLGCCVNVTEEMDGAVLHVPEILYDKRNWD